MEPFFSTAIKYDNKHNIHHLWHKVLNIEIIFSSAKCFLSDYCTKGLIGNFFNE